MRQRSIIALVAVFLGWSPTAAQVAGTVTQHAFAVGRGAGITGYSSALCTAAQLAVGQSAADPLCKTITGDITLSAAGATTLATVNANVGSFGSATSCPAFTVNGKGLITAASAATCTPAIGSITGLGTGVATALGVNVGNMIILGLAVSNGLIALSGALLAQYQGFADVQMGIGMVVWGLASVIIGEALVGTKQFGLVIVGAVMGSVLFRLLVAIALRAGLNPNDLKLITAAFVFAALVLPDLLAKLRDSGGARHA